jgi:tRNA-intron endonuclease
MTQFNGELVDNRIVIPDIEQSRTLFGTGYYGKPLGIHKPKTNLFDAPLILDLIEGCYLIQIGKLKVCRNDGTILSLRDIKVICRKEFADFDSKYLVFCSLREKGYVVTPGIKFGCDFAVYEHGPGIDHAPFLVQVYRPSSLLTATGIVLAGRLATTVKKQFIIAVPKIKQKKVEFIGFDWWRA